MSEQQVKTDMAQDIPGSEVFNEIVPGVSTELIPLEKVSEDRKKHVQQLMAEIDFDDSQSIMFFGSKAQEQLTSISDRMLDGVKNKDIGPAGADLNEMVSTIRGFDVDELDPNKKLGFFARLFGKQSP